MNSYFFRAGRPDSATEDLARYRALDASDIPPVAKRYFPDDARVILSVVPAGHKELAAAARSEADPSR